MRALASQLSLSSGALSEILSGKRRLTAKTAMRIIELLDLPDDEKTAFLNFMEFTREKKRTMLTHDAHELLTDWIYFAILSTFDLEDGVATVEGLSQKLGTKPGTIEAAMERLQKHGLIQKAAGGSFESTHKLLSSTDGVPSPNVVEAHEKNLQLSLTAVRELPVRERDFTSLTFSGDSRKLETAKKQIREFIDHLAAEMCDGDLDQVYQFNLQLFPLIGWEKPE